MCQEAWFEDGVCSTRDSLGMWLVKDAGAGVGREEHWPMMRVWRLCPEAEEEEGGEEEEEVLKVLHLGTFSSGLP